MKAPKRPRGWHRRHPERWAAERRALTATGWRHRIRYDNGVVTLHIEYPLPVHAHAQAPPDAQVSGPAHLSVTFPATYPHFAAEVYDRTDTLGATRHRDPRTGHLCLSHPEDHQPDQLLADMLGEQLPKLLSTSVHAGADDGLEYRAVDYGIHHEPRAATVVVPNVVVPPGLDSGVLVLRHTGGLLHHDRFATTLVTQVLGKNYTAGTEPTGATAPFPYVGFGRWLRDPDYRLGETADEVWERIADKLPPLDVNHASRREFDPANMETIGLLVPGVETGYRSHGDGWVFLGRLALTATDTRPVGEMRWLAGAQYLDEHTITHRTPTAAALATKSAVLIGCGAIGHHIAIDLARTGIGRLTLIDGDTVDPATASRQLAPLSSAGHPKATELAAAVSMNAPFCDFRPWVGWVQGLWEPHPEPDRAAALAARHAVGHADIVIDATADPNVTSFLGAIRYAAGKPFITVAGTAGMWGGWVAHINASRGTGCVECLNHHRTDPRTPIPVPPADPAGWATPARCSSPTFTGTNADAASIAHQASRVAVHELAEAATLGGAYYVAALRNPSGAPQPAAWVTTDLPPHPACRAHPQSHPDDPQPALQYEFASNEVRR